MGPDGLELSIGILYGRLKRMGLHRLISIFRIVTLHNFNVFGESLDKSEIQRGFRFNERQSLGEVFLNNFITMSPVCYLVFVTLTTRVNHFCPQPNEISLRNFFGLLC